MSLAKHLKLGMTENWSSLFFCIENVAASLGKPSNDVYRALSGDNGILHQYIIPSYDVLHTQGKEYIVNDICEVMAERGVFV